MNKSQNCAPLDGAKVYNVLKDKNLVILAVNPQIIPGILEGIMQAAKDLDSVLIVELAKSECNLSGGYTGLTPKTFSQLAFKTASKVGLDTWILHADHVTTKKLSEVEENKKLIKAQIEAGYTSFAIDASYLYNLKLKTENLKLKDNIDVTTELADFIKENYKNENFGLEVEVGEIGKKNQQGLVLTSPGEAVTFLQELAKNDISPLLLAIANGTVHGDVFKDGKVTHQNINIAQTKKVYQAIKQAGFDTKIAQHGITGANLESLKKLSRAGILKGNIGTHWRNLAWEVFSEHEPRLFAKIKKWTLSNFSDKKLSKEEIFAKNSKFAIREFFTNIYNVRAVTIKVLKEKAYQEARKFIKAFNSQGSAKIIRENLK